MTFADTREATEEAALFGTIDEIAAKLERLRAMGAEYMMLNAVGMSRINLRGFAKHIAPAFTREAPRPAARAKALTD